jgi:hypothetical protein
MLLCGRRPALRALLYMRKLFEKEETTYLLNTLWINDLCVAVQSIPDAALRSLSAAASQVVMQLTKTDDAFAAWKLEEIEAAVADGTYGQEDDDESSGDSDSDSDSDGSDDSDSDSDSGESSGEGSDEVGDAAAATS